MTIKEKAERETFARPTNNFHHYGKKNVGGRYAVKTPEKDLETIMNTPKIFRYKPIRPPLKKRG